jgi:SAM-dependent methyltransferase
MDFKKFSPTDWDARANRFKGLAAVMNTAYPPMEVLAETHRQKQFIATLPLPFNRFEAVYGGEQLVDVVQLEESDATLLDVGCGAGRLLPFLGEMAGRADGLDWSGGMLGIAAKNYPDKILFQADVSERSTVEKGEYSIVFAWNVLSHITDKDRWGEAVRNMKYWASSYVVIADYLDIGPESPTTRLYGSAQVKQQVKWEVLYEDTYTLKIGVNDFQTMEVLVFVSPAESKRLAKNEGVFEELVDSAVAGTVEGDGSGIALPEFAAVERDSP